MRKSGKRIHSPNDLDAELLVVQLHLYYVLAREATLTFLGRVVDKLVQWSQTAATTTWVKLTQLVKLAANFCFRVTTTKTFRTFALIGLGFLGALLVVQIKYPDYVIVTIPKKVTLQSLTNQKPTSYVKFSEEETHLLILAHQIGSQYSNYPETIQAIVLQETYAGRYGNRVGDTHQPFGQRSYGVTQCKLSTAKRVLKAYPEVLDEYFDGRKLDQITDEEMIAKLISDDEFAIKVGTLNFVIDIRQYRNWARAVVAYNAGTSNAKLIANPESFEYTQKVMRHIKTNVKPFNQQMGLSSI